MNDLKVEVSGIDTLVSKIKLLATDKSKKREVIMILKQISKPTLEVSKRTTPVSEKPHAQGGKRSKKIVQPGNLRNSVGHIIGRKGNSVENPTVYIGPRVKGQFDGYYGAWVHDGKNIYNKGVKRKRIKGFNEGVKKRTEAKPWLTIAYQQTQTKVTNDAEIKMAAFIQKRINKLSNV